MFNNINVKGGDMNIEIENEIKENEEGCFYMNSDERSGFDDPENKKMNYYAKKRISLYKTEMCRSFEETGTCKYGERCQFAHARNEIRCIERHPRYKTETCRTFWEEGTCPYGKRCCFIHLEQDSKNRADDDSFKEIPEPIPLINCEDAIDDVIFTEVSECAETEKVDVVDIQSYLKNELTFVSQADPEKSNDERENTTWGDPGKRHNLQDYRPFWHTNEALKWASHDNIFCYISHRNHRFHRVTNQPKAPGEPVISYDVSDPPFLLDDSEL